MSAPSGTLGVDAGTTGVWWGMDGVSRRVALKAYAAMALLILVFDTENVFSALREHARSGHPIAVWEPVLWEGSSALAYLTFAPIAYLAATFAPPRRGGWLRFVLVHPPASVLVSSLHILGMTQIRFAVYALLGLHYGGRPFDFVYEYPKDIPAYVLMVGLVWLFREVELRRAQPAPSPAPAAATFDIKDGAKVIRAPVADILALSSAGNYVEVVLADGRRPLIRSTLAAAEKALGPHGFVRTHRSWLVNTGCVRELTATGSGDFTLRLDGGVEAPLSRRFPKALLRLQSTRAC
jgi:hypothetical protein